jgi:MHS family shikimate/dehydroshikimate transporter-like MFS transporter
MVDRIQISAIPGFVRLKVNLRPEVKSAHCFAPSVAVPTTSLPHLIRGLLNLKNSTSGNASIRRVAIASFIGTTIEWYDFFLYGTASALIFAKLFFPKYDPLTGTLASFGTYAVGFAARPIGGIVCGHFGDRIGRKSMLVMTLLIMGVATFLIGLLPTYESIGVWAPVLLVLLRMAQGFGVGGEWGGAVLMAVEHAPKGRRGFYGSWPQVGVPAGLLLSTLVFWQLSKLPEEVLLGWGWRVAFLLSILLVGVGLYIRLAIVEPPTFTEIKQAQTTSRMPILDAVRQHPKNVLLAMGARIAENGAFYLYTVFILTYATQPQIGFSSSSVLGAISLAAILEIFAIPTYGWLSDRLGRRPVYLFGAIFTGVFAFPFFWLVETSNTGLMILAIICALVFGHAAMYGPQASFFSELFGTRVRYSGASLGYQLASVIAGGLSPLIATSLLRRTGSSLPIAIFVIGMAVVTTASVYFAIETADKEIHKEIEVAPVGSD